MNGCLVIFIRKTSFTENWMRRKRRKKYKPKTMLKKGERRKRKTQPQKANRLNNKHTAHRVSARKFNPFTVESLHRFVFLTQL